MNSIHPSSQEYFQFTKSLEDFCNKADGIISVFDKLPKENKLEIVEKLRLAEQNIHVMNEFFYSSSAIRFRAEIKDKTLLCSQEGDQIVIRLLNKE